MGKRHLDVDQFAEAGFVNDRSGKATRAARDARRGVKGEGPVTPPKKGNPLMKRFMK